MSELGRAFGYRYLPVAVFLLLLVYQAIRLYQTPMYNWDGLAYAALAVDYADDQAAAKHAEVFASTREVVPANVWAQLTRGSPARNDFYRDAELFDQQLPLYRGRVLYIGAIKLAHALGARLIRAPVLVSLASYLASALLVFGWLWSSRPGWESALVATCISWLPFMAVSARLSTPDALCTLLVLAAAFMALKMRHVVLSGALVVAAIMARSDTVLFGVVAVCAAFIHFPKNAAHVRRALALLGVFVGTYVAVTLFSGRPGWWTVFWITLVHHTPRWATEVPPFSFEAYWRTVQAYWHPESGLWDLLVFALGIIGVSVSRNGPPGGSRMSAEGYALSALLVTCVARYFVLPRFFDWGRLSAPYYLCICVVSALACWKALGGRVNAERG